MRVDASRRAMAPRRPCCRSCTWHHRSIAADRWASRRPSTSGLDGEGGGARRFAGAVRQRQTPGDTTSLVISFNSPQTRETERERRHAREKGAGPKTDDRVKLSRQENLFVSQRRLSNFISLKINSSLMDAASSSRSADLCHQL